MNFNVFSKAVLLGVTGCATLLLGQESYRNDATVSVVGVFEHTTQGDGINNSGTDSAGLLLTYRYFFTGHQGLELNYGFTRMDEQFTPVASVSLPSAFAVSTNIHEANLSYVLRLGYVHRMRPFASAGIGALVFSPISNFSVNNVAGNRFATPDFVFSAGFELALSRRVSFRLGYRGHLFQTPDFGVSALMTGSTSHLAEPFGGLSFHF